MRGSIVLSFAAAAAFAPVLTPSSALAHAHLRSAVPAAGATISSAPDELQLSFSEGVVPALSSVKVTTAAGAAIAAAKPTADAADPKLLRVHVEKPLGPGAYVVRWHVVATDTHPTSGTYKFTVK